MNIINSPRLQRHSSHRPWDFAVVNVSGHDDVSVADVTTTLDRSLGADGACVGAAVNGCSGPGTDHQRRSENGQDEKWKKWVN